MSEQTPPTPPETAAATDAADERQNYLALGIVFFVLGSTFFFFQESMRFVGLPFLVLGIVYFAWAMTFPAANDDDGPAPSDPPRGGRDD